MQDTLRSALAMGADRALHVTCQSELQPLAVAKLLAAVVQREHPGLCLLGKQAIDDDSNQTVSLDFTVLGQGCGSEDWPRVVCRAAGVCWSGAVKKSAVRCRCSSQHFQRTSSSFEQTDQILALSLDTYAADC